MPRYKQPTTLESLAIKALSNYVYNVSVSVLTSSLNTRRSAANRPTGRLKSFILNLFHTQRNGCLKKAPLRYEHMNRVEDESVARLCGQLQELLHSNIPHVLSNRLTEELLRSLSLAIRQLGNDATAPQCVRALQKLLPSVIHPSVSQLQLKTSSYNISVEVCRYLPHMSRLRELEFSFLMDDSDYRMLASVLTVETEGLIIRGIRALPLLEVFKFPCNCTDRIVEALAETCLMLKCLDLHCSSVSDTSVPSILKLHLLQQVYVTRTALSESGRTALLEGLANNTQDNHKDRLELRGLGCSNIAEPQLLFMVQKFDTLSHVHLVCYQCNIAPLKHLKQLQALRLQTGNFSDVYEILVENGSKLVCLELILFCNIDIELIGRICTRLETLSLKGYMSPIVPRSTSREVAPLPGLLSVQHLCLRTKWDNTLVSYLLCQCLCITKLDLLMPLRFDDRFVNAIVGKPYTLTALRHLSLHTRIEPFTVPVIKRFIKHCVELSTLKISGFGSGVVTLAKSQLTEAFPTLSIL